MPFLGWPELALIVVIMLIIFGPEKLPDMARALGKAMQEYRKASSQIFEPLTTTPKPTEGQMLMETAKKLGIPTEGKTTEQISQEILKKASEVSKEAEAKAAAEKKVEEKKAPSAEETKPKQA